MSAGTEREFDEQIRTLFQGRLEGDEVFQQYYNALSPVVIWEKDFVVFASSVGDERRVVLRLIDRGSLDSREDIKAETTRRDLQREITNKYKLLSHHHPQIEEHSRVLLTDRFVALESTYPYDMVDYEEGNLPTLGSLVELHNGLDESIARWYFRQIVEGLNFCHEMGIAKRQLSLDDCVLHQPQHGDQRFVLTLCGWRKSKADDHQVANSLIGPPGCWPPEAYVAAYDETQYELFPVDMFWLGITLYKMLYGREQLPVQVSQYQVHLAAERRVYDLRMEAEGRASAAEPEQHVFQGVTAECCALLNGLLQSNAQHRWDMAAVQNCSWYQAALPVNAMHDNQGVLNNFLQFEAPQAEIAQLLAAAIAPGQRDRVIDVGP